MPTRFGIQFKPMLAIAPPEDLPTSLEEELGDKSWIISPKIDGIRCLIIDGKPFSRSLKPIRNRALNKRLQGLFIGWPWTKNVILDGELHIRYKPFWDTSSCVMSHEHEETDQVTYTVFDAYFREEPTTAALKRLRWIRVEFSCMINNPQVSVIWSSIEKYSNFILECELQKGHEGIMLRDPDSPYKFGRSTWNEKYLIKIKPLEHAEATCVGFEELKHNSNPAGVNELGYTERSSSISGLDSESNLLGSLICEDPTTKETIKIGTGFTMWDRQIIWENKRDYRHRIVRYKYQKYGTKDAPRCPTFLGFKEEED